MITNETEAFTKASCRAFKGKTERNLAMHMEGRLHLPELRDVVCYLGWFIHLVLI
jgi:hypothetical protein